MTRKRDIRVWLAAALLVLGLTPATQAAAAVPAEIVAGEAQELRIEVNKGRLVRLARPAATVFIANPDIADLQVKSSTLVYIFGKRAGDTTLYAVDSRDRVVASLAISVTHNISGLENALKRLLPGTVVDVRSVDDSLVLSGAVATAEDAEEVRRLARRFVNEDTQIINRLNVAGPNQIHLRVRVAEVSRDVVKEFGVNFDAAVLTGNFVFNLFTGASAVSTPLLSGSLLPVEIPARRNDVNNVFGRFATGEVDVNTLIDALDDEGLISILAEPNLTALSGETASFLAGGEFPVPIPQDENTVTIEFKQFGVHLAFTPVLLSGGRINLRVAPEVSQLSSAGSVNFSGFNIPALTTRRAETTVELASGQSFAIAGLLQNDANHDVTKFPGLGDLPVLGTLFRSTRFQRNETELVIIVTPYVVRPVSAKRMAMPTDGLIAPNDTERILHGYKYKQHLPEGAAVPVGPRGERLAGPVGFVLE